MMKPRFLVFFTCMLIAMAGTGQAAEGSLAGSEWGLGSGDDRFVQFGTGGRLSGHAGCNRFFTSYRQRGSKLKIAGIATTKKLCGDTTMRQERQWLDLLKRVRQIAMTHSKLVFYGSRREKLATLRRRDFD